MNKAYKMLALRALIDGNALFDGMDIAENARLAFEGVRDDLLLFREMREDEDRQAFGAAFIRKWREMPLAVWARGESTRQPWFELKGDRFVAQFVVLPEDRAVFENMTEEMVELRLSEARDRRLRKQEPDAAVAPILLTVSHSQHRPILRFMRERRPDTPTGETWVNVDGERFLFPFQAIAVNKVWAADGTRENVLPTLMRRWFGPAAGHPGTRHRVTLGRVGDEWVLHRQPEVTPSSPPAEQPMLRPQLLFFPDVRVACGALETSAGQGEFAERVNVVASVPLDAAKHFVVRASGDSMNGGSHPIADGDLVLCEWTRGASPEALEGRAHLLVGSDAPDTSFAVMKVPHRTSSGWTLESWNPAFPPQPIPESVGKLEAVARVVQVVTEDLGLVLWGEYSRDAIVDAFGGKNDPSWKVGHRDIEVAGKPHTILMVTLRKDGQTRLEHRYADGLVSPTEMNWDSQDSTTSTSAKGRRIIGHVQERRTVHMFARYDSHQDFRYLGPVTYVTHEGDAPMQVRWRLHVALPDALFKLWS